MNRYKKVKLASILGIIGNIFLFVIKFIIGIFTNSQAMIADSINSGSDIISSIITFVGNKIASKPSDDDHNLGHGKAEYIYSMLISIVMIILALTLLKNSTQTLFINKTINFSFWLIIICFLNIIIKFGLYFYTNKIAKNQNNLLIKANSKDHFCDAIISCFTLISSVLIFKKIFIVDIIVGISISLFIIYTAIKIFIESYDVLMDKSISEETKCKVYEIIKEHKEIVKTNHFNSTPVGYKYQISFTIFVDGKLSTFKSHEIADKLEKEINDKIDEIYLTVIHVNPIKTANKKEI